MSTRKRKPTPVSSALKEMPMLLSKDALDDLSYIDPIRSRDRIVSALNELFWRVVELERLHQPEKH